MQSGDKNIFSGTITQLFAATSGALFAISDGMVYGWTAPMIPYFKSNDSHIPATEYEAEWMETTLMAGSLLGLPITIYGVNKIGRKFSIILAALIALCSWIIIAVANSLLWLHVARFIFGVTGNMAFVAAPMYIAEVADHKIRGFLSSIIYLMMLVGFVIVYSVGPYLPFVASPIIGGVIIVVGLSIFSFMPKSPYYLIYNNKFDEAKRSLKYFRPGRDVDQELQEIMKAVQRQKTERGRIQDIVLVKSNRKAIVIMSTLNLSQHIGAISVVLMNLHSILEAAGSIYMEPPHAGILFSVIMLISAQSASCLVDRYGRKALLIVSAILTGFCLLTLAIYFNLKLDGYDVKGASWIPIVSVMIYAATFKIGLGIVPIIITAEIFSAKMKALGMTIADAMYVIGAIISVQIYQWLGEVCGIHVPFYIFAVGSFTVCLFVIFYIPETKGKTLEEIQLLLKGKSSLQHLQQTNSLLRTAT